MNILVCISRVPDTATKVMVGSDGKTIEASGIKYVVNPYDEFAIEEGLRLREKNGGSVTAITVGTETSKDVLRTAYAMGVDKAALIKGTDQFDSFYVSKNLAEYAKDKSFDLLLLGRQSVDYDSLQVPSMLAEFLGMPAISVVSKLTIDGGKAIAERDIEGGRETVEAGLPCVISAQKGLNEPRYPKLPDIMKAKSKPIEEIAAIQTDATVTILGMEIPMKQRRGKIVDGSDDNIGEIVRLLHEEAKII
ncbi:MAG: electron transfer flavoprotein beta subunit [Bacteroidota bacterium]|nr:electron transfer flavoprotein beta subunit [Bacteroidota bacterium]